MARFQFTTIERDTVRDDDAVDLPDVDAAKRVAAIDAGDVLREVADTVFERDLQIRVADVSGLVLFTINATATEAPALRGSSLA